MESYYINRINHVINYIEQNLDDDLSLKVISKVASISPYHFHRIFSLVSGETIHQFVTRKRIEKIAASIINKKKISINEISLKYGFDSATSFSRTFKKYYGVNASSLRRKSDGNFNRIKQNSKNCKESIDVEKYICNTAEVRQWAESNNTQIKKVRLTELKLAYVRHKGSFDGVLNSFNKLKRWVDAMSLLKKKEGRWVMVIHDNPSITEERLMTQSACVPINSKTYNLITLKDEISIMSIPEGNFLRGHFKIDERNFKNAWDAMSVWMMDNNYEARDGHYFEMFHTDSIFHKNQKHLVDIYIPIL